jgi:SSS family solute:Na+ symporter
MPAFRVSTVDLFIIAAYLIFIIWRGISYAKAHENAEEYFLAGRSLTWPLVGLSLYASNMSSSSLIGLAGSGYGTGISVYAYEYMATVVLVFFAAFFLPQYLRSRVYTMPEFLERRYDARSRYYFSGLTILGTIIIDTAGALYAGALVIKLAFPEIPIWQSILALALVSGLYTVAGGLRAVVYTDAFQGTLLTVGSIIITVLVFVKIGSWEAVKEVTPPEQLRLMMPLDDPFLPWPGALLGVPILGFYFWCTNQFMVQRVLGAKDTNHGRWGALFAGLLKLPLLFIMVLPGTMARVLYPDLPNPDLVYPTLLFDLLPVGVLGLVLAGLIAAIMSSIDSTLNSASTLVTMDFFRKLRPQTSNEGLMWVGRVFTAVFMILAAAWAPQIENFPSLFQYLQSVLAYLSPPIVALFLVGLFWKRANGHGAFAALVVGFGIGVTGITMVVLGMDTWLARIHFLYIAPLMLAVCSLTIVVVSLLTHAPKEEQVKAYIWNRSVYNAESAQLRGVPWYKNYRVLSVALLALTALIVLSFW